MKARLTFLLADMNYCNHARDVLWKWKDGIFLPCLCSIRLAVYVAEAMLCQGLARVVSTDHSCSPMSACLLKMSMGEVARHLRLTHSTSAQPTPLPDSLCMYERFVLWRHIYEPLREKEKRRAANWWLCLAGMYSTMEQFNRDLACVIAAQSVVC